MKLELLADRRPPFYLVAADRLRQRYRAFVEAFAAEFPRLVVGYSYKTNYVPGVLRVLHGEGAYAEVVSGLEYELATRLGVAPEQIILNGVNKTRDLLERALEEGAICNLDSMCEVDHAVAIARALGRPLRVGIRINLSQPRTEDERVEQRSSLMQLSQSKPPTVRDRAGGV